MNFPGKYDLLHRRSKLRFKRRIVPAGAAPGTFATDPEAKPSEIRVMAYGPDGVIERALAPDQDARAIGEGFPVLWVNVDGLGDAEVLRALAEGFGAHRLAIADAINLGQRAKMERYGRQVFIVLRMPLAGIHGTEQVSLLVGEGFVLSMQEQSGGVFEPVRERIRKGFGRLRHAGTDYLAYALIDAVVDGYFPVLETLGDELDALEDEVFGDPDKETLARLHALKRDLVNLRKAIWPHRDMLVGLERDATDLIPEETRHHMRDAYDHVVRIIDLADALREVSTDLMSTYLTMVSNRMNEVMKVLTVVATIFIPLGFIAGVYGMNFDTAISRWNMPELSWAFGYPAVLLFMLVAAGGMLLYMRSRRWL
jgi:magnesium transporter